MVELDAHARVDRTSGLTLLELLIVLAMLTVLFALGVVGWRMVLEREDQRSALASFQQALWQGSTLAASRGENVVVRYEADEFVLVDGAGATLRRYEVSDQIQTSLTEGHVLTFTAPGRATTLESLPDPLTMTVNDEVHVLEVSLIGETRVLP